MTTQKHSNDYCLGWNAAKKVMLAEIIKVAEILDAQQVPPAKPESVALKFKIYKPTTPDPMRNGINNALLPWVYDQDRSSGFDASMWVTPIATMSTQPVQPKE